MRKWGGFCVVVVVLGVTAASCRAQEDQNSEDRSAAALRQKAEAGDAAAQYEIGREAEQEQNYREAFKWFERAAKQGLNGAEVDLAYLYAAGFGAPKDFEQSLHWYRLAAAQNNPNAEFSLGIFYLHGEGVEQDLAQARKWFSLSIRDGDGARSQNAMGLTYELGPELDLPEAFSWYNKAAAGGYHEAQYNVCRLTAQGLAVPNDYAAALKWCHILADTGDPWGQYGMALICKTGVGMAPDLQAAAEWDRKAAEQGHPAAQFDLGVMYAEGKGVKQDLIQAYLWIALAGSRKHPEAQDYLENLVPKMTKAQISSGQELARRWAQNHSLDPETSQTLDHIGYDRP